MIVELPDPHCRLACNSRFRGHFEAARATVIAQLGGAAGPPSGHFQRLTPPRLVVVTGVGFFDFLHGQTGVAPNGIELHPVLGIVFP
jgi:hypothetical protein